MIMVYCASFHILLPTVQSRQKVQKLPIRDFVVSESVEGYVHCFKNNLILSMFRLRLLLYPSITFTFNVPVNHSLVGMEQ